VGASLPSKGESDWRRRTEEAMTDQNEENTEKNEMRVMWIMSGVIVLIIVGLMGMSMLTNPNWMHGG
jgi:hypothetical protein